MMGSPEQPKSPPSLPAPPDPSADPGVVPSIRSPAPEDDSTPEELDIWTLKPVTALKMLCRSIDALVKMTGDIPPTPPVIRSGGGNTRDIRRLWARDDQLSGQGESHTTEK